MRFPFIKRAGGAGAPAVHDPQAAEARAATVPAEVRAAGLPEIAQSAPGAEWVAFWGLAGADTAGEAVTIDSALSVPAFGAGVGFLARTLAALPCHVYEKDGETRRKVEGDPVAALLNEAPNDETSAFDWRRGVWQDVFTAGRSVSFIERNRNLDPINLWPLDTSRLRIERRDGRKLYHYRDTAARSVTYSAGDVLDLQFMPAKAGAISARSPVYQHAATFGLALAVTRYGRRFFANGGVPPFYVTGPFRTAEGAGRAQADISAQVQAVTAGNGNALALPEGHALHALGIDPEKMQMERVQRFLLEEMARILTLPPVFLGDLTKGTLANVEQEDLRLVKHTLVHWISAWEGEINLKFFGRGGRSRNVRVNLDAIMRGDFKSRAEALARLVGTGQMTPDEARALEDRAPIEGGDKAYMQGAMAPLGVLAAGRGSGIGAAAGNAGNTAADAGGDGQGQDGGAA